MIPTNRLSPQVSNSSTNVLPKITGLEDESVERHEMHYLNIDAQQVNQFKNSATILVPIGDQPTIGRHRSRRRFNQSHRINPIIDNSQPNAIQRNNRGRKRRKKPTKGLQNVRPAFSSQLNYENQINSMSNPSPSDKSDVRMSLPFGVPRMDEGSSNLLGAPILGQNLLINASMLMFPAWKVWQFTPCSKSCGGGNYINYGHIFLY